jgi:hypothetical protein
MQFSFSSRFLSQQTLDQAVEVVQAAKMLLPGHRFSLARRP